MRNGQTEIKSEKNMRKMNEGGGGGGGLVVR